MTMMVGAILLWIFAPIDKAIDSVLPTFNNTGYSSEGGGRNVGDDLVPSPSPTVINKAQFMRCKKDKECCNGLDKICHLGVDEIMYATVHNA